jgi:hypothetical protein
MFYLARLYTPDKAHSHYLVDFDLDRLAAPMRRVTVALGPGRADRLVAVTDTGNGIEAALRSHFQDNFVCILDREPRRRAPARLRGGPAPRLWAGVSVGGAGAEGILYERVGAARGRSAQKGGPFQPPAEGSQPVRDGRERHGRRPD